MPDELNRELTIGTLLAEAYDRLLGSATETPRREATLLLGQVLEASESTLYAFPERQVTAAAAARFADLVERRAQGEPVAYLLGEREFWSRPFRVDPRVLIPRPETEHLIEAALELELPAGARVLDLGTGSGAIAITLALEIESALVTAVDLSFGALAIAADNRARQGARDRVDLVCADLTTALRLEPFDLVVSNPPYIAESALPDLAVDVAEHEPRMALTADREGTEVLRRLSEELGALEPGSHLLVEIGHDQEAVARDLFSRHFVVDRVGRDYAGHPRWVVGRRR